MPSPLTPDFPPHMRSHHTQEVIGALSVLRTFLSDTVAPPIPPQIIVKANGKRRAYGRNSLKGMSYDEASSMFIEKFAIDDDWTTTAGGGHYPPRVLFFATFWTVGSDRGSALLDESGWPELVDNIEKIRLVFIPRSVGVQEVRDVF